MARDRSSDEYLELKTELRSILISSQQGCTEQQLMKDYAAYNCKKDIPYRRMGYSNLVELLMSMPDVARIEHTRIPLIIHGVADQNTAHIKKMVMTQKRKKKTGNARGGVTRNSYGNYRPNYTTTYSRTQQSTYHPTSNGLHFQPFHQITNTPRNQWDTSGLPTTNRTSLPNDQNRSIPLNQPTTTTTITTNTKMVASFPPKSTVTPPLISSTEIASIRATPILDDSSSAVDEDLNCSADDELAEYDAQQAQEHGEKIIHLRKCIRQLLLRFTSGVWLTSVHKLYKKIFNEELKLEDYKLKTLMMFLDCISDFVDSRRDRRADSTDRLFSLKTNFIEAAKREQQNAGQPTETLTSLSDYNEPSSNEIARPIVDLSPFVPLDFQYRSLEYTSSEPFSGFLGGVEDPWNIHLGNTQFIPIRDRMMAQLQEHYKQSSDESIYLIPFEQIHIHLCCIYYHDDGKYYRALIYHIDPTTNHDLLFLTLYLVDFGRLISNIPFRSNSVNLRFLHKNFSTLSTQVYDCRLADICYPSGSNQWPKEARQSIVDLCEGADFQVQIVGTIDGFYSIYLWNDLNHRQSVNQLLVQQGFAVKYDDNPSAEFEAIVPKTHETGNENLPRETNAHQYLNEKLFSKPAFEYHPEENHLKYLLISIQHGYYLVKHPFTKRPCLPCFELSRLLSRDEQAIVQLNLIRDTELSLLDSYTSLYDQLIDLPESRMCPHLHDHARQPKIILYDLSSIRDYLYKIKYNDGDVLDAFQKEYADYERPGYWNEKKNSYINETNFQTHHDNLNQRHDLLNIRKNQLLSLSKTTEQPSTHNELHQLNQELSSIGQELTSMQTILPSANKENLRAKSKLSAMKMRETLFRIARPFDQQFALNIRFNHQPLANETLLHEDEDEIEERFSDLGRILKNILQFFLLESDLSDEKNRYFLNQAEEVLPDLIDRQQLLTKRIDIYNYCLDIIEYCQPLIRSYVQRTDLIDTIY